MKEKLIMKLEKALVKLQAIIAMNTAITNVLLAKYFGENNAKN